MGENTKIEWTDHSWNPWYGCHKVSQGCKNCYMFREQRMYGRDPNVVLRSKTTFGAPLHWQKKAVKAGVRERVFTCSWSDFFIEEADPIRYKAWDIMRHCPDLVFQVLTKRPERIGSCLPEDWGEGYPNVWLGVSAEDQGSADLRIPLLLQIPARVRFVSAEPLLGKVDLWDWLQTGMLHWVIAGGESGPEARVMELGWIRYLRDQCAYQEMPFFFKQWGEWTPEYPQGLSMANRKQTYINGCMYYRVGRREAGHVLDGKEWRELPGLGGWAAADGG